MTEQQEILRRKEALYRFGGPIQGGINWALDCTDIEWIEFSLAGAYDYLTDSFGFIDVVEYWSRGRVMVRPQFELVETQYRHFKHALDMELAGFEERTNWEFTTTDDNIAEIFTHSVEAAKRSFTQELMRLREMVSGIVKIVIDEKTKLEASSVPAGNQQPKSDDWTEPLLLSVIKERFILPDSNLPRLSKKQPNLISKASSKKWQVNQKHPDARKKQPINPTINRPS